MDGVVVSFEEVGVPKMVERDRHSWEKPRLIVCLVLLIDDAGCGGGDDDVRFIGTCSEDKRTKPKAGTRMPHVANK
jgi:hypothetical protein